MKRADSGFTLLEMLVSLGVLSLAMGALASMMISSARLNRAEQSQAQVQANARACLLLVVQHLRSAGWNPTGLDFEAVTVDPDLTDEINWIEFRSDRNGDGDLNDDFEQVVIRHVDRRVEWRTSAAGDFVALADDISNDADGDGVAEAMFEVFGDPAEEVELKITAESPLPNSNGGQPIRYTVESEVLLRPRLLPLR